MIEEWCFKSRYKGTHKVEAMILGWLAGYARVVHRKELTWSAGRSWVDGVERLPILGMEWVFFYREMASFYGGGA